MKNQAVGELNHAKSKMAGDIKTVIADGEDLLNEGIAVAQDKFEEKLGSARARLADVSKTAVVKARKTAAAADGYVHDNPWPVIGVVAAAGLVIGFLASRR
jgi:ElaB/YqjD/DUF883 family membrane-anchored ribosome-binding protein